MFLTYDSPSFSSNMPLLDLTVLYPAPKVQRYSPTPRKPSHENPLGIVFPEDTEKETMVTGDPRVRQGSPPEDLMMVKIDGTLDLLVCDNFGPHFYCATAYYPGETAASLPRTRSLDLPVVVLPQHYHWHPKIESSANWPLFRGFESSGSLAVQVHIPQLNSAGPKFFDCTTSFICKSSKRSNAPPMGFPEPVSPLSRTLPYRCKRSERSDTPPEGFPEPVSPSRVARPALLESLRHGKQTPEEKKCKALLFLACLLSI